MSAASSVVQLSVTLDDVKPPVTRMIVVPLNIRLDRLHIVLQEAMGWTNSHLWEFRIRGIGYGEQHPDYGYDNPVDARKATLKSALEDTGARKFTYLYDFGDGWEHSIKVGKIMAAIPDVTVPMIVDAKGCCPPEDCGGPWGYSEMLEAYNDPTHEEHEEAREWMPEDFDPTYVNMVAIEHELSALSIKWTPKPRKKA